MATQVIQCQFCNRPMQLPEVTPGQSVCCPSCNRVQSLDGTPDPPQQRFQQPKTMPCPSCGEHFGFTDEMVGQAVACPFCKKQINVSGENAPEQVEVADDEPVQFEEVESVESELPPTTSTTLTQQAPADVAKVDRAVLDKWLPPTFDLGADDRFAAPSQKSRALDINTNITRIQVSDERVPVRTISRQEKDRRRRIRVLCVCTISIIWLVIIFWILLR